MAMKKSIWIVLVIVMLVMSSQLCFVHSRVLRSKKELKTEVADNSPLRMAPFNVSSNNSTTTRASKRSFAFRMASGPSKKGPGH